MLKVSIHLLRYELPAPSSGQKNDITAWQECVNNSMAQLEHQAVRIENLELMSQYGTNGWKAYNECVQPRVVLHSVDAWWRGANASLLVFFLLLFSNLAFMIEMAQKEHHKFRWTTARKHFASEDGVRPVLYLQVFVLLLRKQIQDLNWQRKNDQLAAGAKLRELESK